MIFQKILVMVLYLFVSEYNLNGFFKNIILILKINN